MSGNEWLSSYDLDQGLVQTITAPAYPFIAWSINEAAWVAEVDKCDSFDLVLPWNVEEVVFGRGHKRTKKECYVSPAARVCILAERTRWFDRVTGERIAGYREGAYSKLHLLALVEDATAVPVVLTIKGVAAGELSKQLTALRRNVIATARRKLNKPSLSEAGFWLTLRAGQPMMVGAQQQTEITPPMLELPGKGTDLAEWLGARFVGPAILDLVNALADEVKAWRDDAGHAGPEGDDEAQAAAPSTNGEPHDEDLPGEPPSEPYRMTPVDEFWGKAGLLGLQNHPLIPGLAQSAVSSGNWAWAIAALDGLATPAPGAVRQGG